MKKLHDNLVAEYRDLLVKRADLGEILDKYESGTLEEELSCPIELIRWERMILGDYIYALEMIAKYEGVNLSRRML